MKYLRKFASESDYNAAEKSPVKAYVSLVGRGIKYDPKMAKGVYIQHIDGKLYDETSWSNGGFSNDAANGVAVISAKATFVIAKQDVGNRSWGSYELIDGIMTTDNVETALTDFAGYDNTQFMISTYTYSSAGSSCANFTFPNGNKGYLPALGELNEVYLNKSKINSLMEIIGGTTLSNRYWSSTQVSTTSSWEFNFSFEAGQTVGKGTTTPYVRAFSKL